MSIIHTRRYGDRGPAVVIVHGGPAAPGAVAPLGRALAATFRVFEPFQRGSSDVPLTVAQHVADMHDVIETHLPDERPAIVGHSWGAMLTLAYAAEHPGRASSLALVGCGTFSTAARSRMKDTIAERSEDPEIAEKMASIERDIDDPNERMAAYGKLMGELYAYELLPSKGPDEVNGDALAHEETWADALRQQEEGAHPAAFANITEPAIMLHGDHDPHPGRMIFAGLQQIMPQLQYSELPRCGHEPWRERYARDEFYRRLRQWLRDTTK